MTYKLFAFVILLLTCDLTPIIYAGKPSLAKSPHIVTLKSSTNVQSTTTPPTKQQQIRLKNAQFDKGISEDLQKPVNVEATDISADPMPLPNELKQDTASYLPWNYYANTPQSALQFPYNFPFPTLASMFENISPFSTMPKLLPFFGYFQPLFIPFPVMMTPDMFYPAYTDVHSLSEQAMSRTPSNGRRPITPGSTPNFSRNSPMYYVRLPPTPYMFLPNFNYAPTPRYPPLLPYTPISALPALPMSSIFNLPLNFVGNGKPSGIYRIDGPPSELSNSQFPFTGTRPSHFSNSYPMRPVTSNPSPQSASSTFSAHHPATQFTFPTPSTSSTPTQHDSKRTTFKGPFVFNGRPDDIYILPNNFNPSMYSEGSFY